MGFTSSSCSFTRFRVVEEISKDFWPTVPNLLKKFAFRDIDHTNDERSFGWVCIDDMLDTEWTTAPPEKAHYFAFSLRLDTRRIPAAVMKKHLTIAMRQAQKELAEQGKKFLSRDQKRQIKEQVQHNLMSRVLPIPAVFDVSWNIEKNVIYFASVQAKAVDLFTDYFTETFDLHLEPLTPFWQALRHVGEDSMHRLEQVDPAQFV